MIFDETRDNLTDIETQSIEADAHADTREADDNRPMERRVADSWWATRNAEAAEQDADIGADWAAAGYPGDGVDDTGDDPEADHIRNSRHIRLVEDPIGDADTDYDIEFDDGADENHPLGGDDDAWHGHGDDDEPEDDGQPSEYEEWQDFMGGDDWDHGQFDEGGY